MNDHLQDLQIDTGLANRQFFRRKYNDQGPSFSQFHYEMPIFNEEMPVQVCLEARVDKGFFLANNYWTCYRRNYFQMSSTLQLLLDSTSLDSIQHTTVLINKKHCKVIDFSIGIIAKSSTNDRNIDLVQHTAKRDKGPQVTPKPKKVKIGGSLSNTNSLTDTQSIVSYERIQFKSATANNGKRRAQQQFFILILEVLADIEIDGNIEQRRIGFAVSDHLVVRGRSPGHYSDTHAERAGLLAQQGHEKYSQFQDMQREMALAQNVYGYTPYSPAASVGIPSNQSSPNLNSSPNLKAGLPVLDLPVEKSMYSESMMQPIQPDWYNVEVPTIESLEQFSNQMQKIQEQMSQQMSSYTNEHQYQYSQIAEARTANSSPLMHPQYYTDSTNPQMYYSVSAPTSRSNSPFQLDSNGYPQSSNN
eukprot:NODE_168_length_14557_cov_0.729008.p5 type:complete len:417 gc:universal NODE_168_length_14557_cov_0.729008:4442-3192(-)